MGMNNYGLNKESFKNISAVSIIIMSGLLVVLWKNYEANILEEAKTIIIDSIAVKDTLEPELLAKIDLLEKMAMAERSKITVMVEHDNSPLTDTYPMIMDATSSFDPDLGDEIQFVWKQIAGPPVDINPNPFSGKVSFEGKEGEYTFELTVSDNYNSKTTLTKTVIIIPEPNQPPVIDMEVRQGSELK
jgi:hypothetical protein